MRFVLFLIPTLIIAGDFTTSLGDIYPYQVSAITTDSTGNTYVVGSRSLGNPVAVSGILGAVTAVPIETGLANFLLASTDVFVSKLDPNGKLVFTDTFAGKGVDTGTAIALDPAGNIYIAGTTTSSDFPLSKALQTQSSASGTGFIMKLSNDGTTILYSTCFGGTTGASSVSALATDAKGNLYVTGSSNAPDFPQTSGLPVAKLTTGDYGISGAIIAEISAAGDKILYSAVIAAAASAPPLGPGAGGNGIALDPAGNVYIAGYTNGPDSSSTPSQLPPNAANGFVAKVSTGGMGLAYFTYVDSPHPIYDPATGIATSMNAIAVDASGNAYIAGWTSDSSFPVTAGSYQPTYALAYPANFRDGFIAKLDPSGSAIIWGTYLDAGGGDVAQSIAIDASGNVWASGTTTSSSFPNTNGWFTGGPFLTGGADFLIGLNSSGSKSIYSALYPTGTAAQSISLDPSGLIHMAGVNGVVSAISPSTAPPMEIFGFQNAFGGNVTGRISPAEVVAIFGPGIGPATAVSAAPVNGFYPTTLSGVQVTMNGTDIPLLYVSANQINAVVPMELAVNSRATVHVTNGTTVSPDDPVWIVPSAPRAFPMVLNQDGTINSLSNPAKSGSIVTFYTTGWQPLFPGLADGQVATSANNVCVEACPTVPSNNDITQTALTVLYGGAAPGIVAGVTQFNVQVFCTYPNQATFALTNSTMTETFQIAP